MRDRTELQENPAYQLWLATNAWQRVVRRALQPVGLTHAQHVVLKAVWILGDQQCVTQADVCRFASLDPNMASEVVRSLVQKGFLERREHPSDRRAHRLDLTPEGEHILKEVKRIAKPVSDAFFAPLGEQRKDLAKMLHVLVDHDGTCAEAGFAPCLDRGDLRHLK